MQRRKKEVGLMCPIIEAKINYRLRSGWFTRKCGEKKQQQGYKKRIYCVSSFKLRTSGNLSSQPDPLEHQKKKTNPNHPQNPTPGTPRYASILNIQKGM